MSCAWRKPSTVDDARKRSHSDGLKNECRLEGVHKRRAACTASSRPARRSPWLAPQSTCDIGRGDVVSGCSRARPVEPHPKPISGEPRKPPCHKLVEWQLETISKPAYAGTDSTTRSALLRSDQKGMARAPSPLSGAGNRWYRGSQTEPSVVYLLVEGGHLGSTEGHGNMLSEVRLPSTHLRP